MILNGKGGLTSFGLHGTVLLPFFLTCHSNNNSLYVWLIVSVLSTKGGKAEQHIKCEQIGSLIHFQTCIFLQYTQYTDINECYACCCPNVYHVIHNKLLTTYVPHHVAIADVTHLEDQPVLEDY